MKSAELLKIVLPAVLPLLLPITKACAVYLYGLAQYKATYIYVYSSAMLQHPIKLYTFVPFGQEGVQQIIQSKPQQLHKLQCTKREFGVPPGYRVCISCYGTQSCVALLVEDGCVVEKFLLGRGGRYRLVVGKEGVKCVPCKHRVWNKRCAHSN
jgi:hypothetical protein